MIKTFDDKEQISRAAADLFIHAAKEAQDDRGRFVVALTGGSSPEKLYTLLSSSPYVEQVDWSRVYVFWGDERWVPLDDDKSNAKMADRTLLTKVPIPKDQIFYMWAADTAPEAFAQTYEDQVKNVLGDDLSFDLVLLGMGPDGHTASLFPGESVVHENEKLVAAYYLDPQSMYRITLTAPLINKAKEIVVMLYGKEKAPALYEVLQGEHNPDLYPAQLLEPENGNITWLIDNEAATALKR